MRLSFGLLKPRVWVLYIVSQKLAWAFKLEPRLLHHKLNQWYGITQIHLVQIWVKRSLRNSK